MIKKTAGIIFVIIIFFTFALQAQSSRVLTLPDYTYEYIQRLQHRGHMLDLSPTVLPYSYGQVKTSLSRIDTEKLSKTETTWVDLIKERIYLNESNESEIGTEVEGAINLSDTERLDPIKPLNQQLYAYPAVKIGGYYERGDLIGQLSFQHDYYYDQDPDGIDAARRLYVRAEDSYLGYQSNDLRIMLGRFHNQWGKYGETSSIISTNAHSFDQINISFGGKYISFQSILGELNGITADDEFLGGTFTDGSKNRFITIHRINIHPSPKFRLSFFESIVYSGTNTGISLKYSNPLLLHSFVSDNYPKNDQNNLLLGGMLWTQFKNFTLNGQFLLDDIEVLQITGEPTTFSIISSLNYALKKAPVDLNLEFEAVAYQTYNTDQAEGRYLYLNKGIATPTNDYLKVKIYPELFLDQQVRGLMVAPYITYYAKGEQEINQEFTKRNPDGSVIDNILTGQEESTIRGGLHILYQPTSQLWFELDTGYNHIDNYRNISGSKKSRLVTLFKAGFRIGFYGNN